MTTLPLRIAWQALRGRGASIHYGSGPRQVADLHLPDAAGPHPIAVVLHGGHWQAPYTRLVMRPLCVDLARRGIAALNVEYRRLGREGGGWPQTFEDVAAAIDQLARPGLPDADLDLERVTLVGHSAGGQLALWAAARGGLPPGATGAAPRVSAVRVLALSAVCDLPSAGAPARRLLGGSRAEVPDRWEQADPMRRIPLAIPVGLVHGRDDKTVSIQRSRDYLAAARQAEADVTLTETAGNHRDSINPGSAAWAAAVDWLGAGLNDAGSRD